MEGSKMSQTEYNLKAIMHSAYDTPHKLYNISGKLNYDGIKTIAHDFIDNSPYHESIGAKVYPDNDDNLSNSHVKLISVNRCGLSNWKLSNEILGACFKLYDIILLQETCTSSGDVISLNVHEYYNFSRKYKQHLAVKNSVGLGVFIKSTLA